MFEIPRPKFEMKSVVHAFAIILFTLCHEVLLVHVHQLEASVVQHGKPVHRLCISAKDVRRSIPHVDVRYVLIRFKVLNDLSLEQLVTGNVQSICSNTRMSGYRLVACGIVLAMVSREAGFAMLLHLLLPLDFPVDHLMRHTFWGCEIFFI